MYTVYKKYTVLTIDGSDCCVSEKKNVVPPIDSDWTAWFWKTLKQLVKLWVMKLVQSVQVWYQEKNKQASKDRLQLNSLDS